MAWSGVPGVRRHDVAPGRGVSTWNPAPWLNRCPNLHRTPSWPRCETGSGTSAS